MKQALVILLLAGLAFAAAEDSCFVCGQKLKEKFYRMKDMCTEAQVAVCPECEQLEAHCFACGLPVKTNYHQLPDGRYLCARDHKEAVLTDEEAKEICLGVGDELNRQFSRFMVFPTTNVTFSIVNRFTLQQLFKSPGYEQACVSVFGATLTQRLPDDRFAHAVHILSALSKPRLTAVCAHELAHAWLRENLSARRKETLAQEAVEGFCELIAYRLLETRPYPVELRIIKANPYTRGQIEALLMAEHRHGFDAVLEWIKAGEDSKLDTNDLARVRAVAPQALQPATAPVWTPVASPPVPDKLVLKGVSIGLNRSLALINDKTFAVQEVGKVRVGQSNLLIRCLEIRTNAAVIQIEHSGEKQELILGAE